MHISSDDFLLSSYHFSLPKGQVAQDPLDRGCSRLLVVNRGIHKTTHTQFKRLIEYLPPNALLVANNTKVVPVRIFCEHYGDLVEFFLLTSPYLLERNTQKSQQDSAGWFTAVGEGLIRPSKKIAVGDILFFQEHLKIEIMEKASFGRHIVKLFWRGILSDIFFVSGHIPLPPYIQRSDNHLDMDKYQTIYAKSNKAGSVAAPTAGLHFSLDIQEGLKSKGISWVELTLHVGYGTFSPVRDQDIRKHIMHEEFVDLSESTVYAIQKACNEGRPVIAVGTTSVRALEGVFALHGSLQPYTGMVNLFVFPSFSFKVVDGLITNFHQPGSTLLMLVSAFLGREFLLDTYNEAIGLGYRFFSYGDAMLIV